jgi:lipoprotein-anchoring transpeptidase ErfK/SrfK
MTVQRINTRGSIGGAKGRGALATALLLVAVEALAQEKQSTPTRPIRATSESAERVTTRRIVVSIPDRKLALIEDGRLVKAYPVAVGAPASPSPAGEFTIAHRIAHPTYYAPGVIIPPGQANPLGTRWLGLDQRGYGIHGTNQPHSIGHRASHGCIRMRNHDMEELFELVEVGDAVELHAERTAELAEIFGGPEVSAAVGQD